MNPVRLLLFALLPLLAANVLLWAFVAHSPLAAGAWAIAAVASIKLADWTEA